MPIQDFSYMQLDDLIAIIIIVNKHTNLWKQIFMPPAFYGF